MFLVVYFYGPSYGLLWVSVLLCLSLLSVVYVLVLCCVVVFMHAGPVFYYLC